MRPLLACAALFLAAGCSKAAEPPAAAPQPGPGTAEAPAAPAQPIVRPAVSPAAPLAGAPSPTAVAPTWPDRPTAVQEGDTVILRGKGERGLFGVEVRFPKPQISALFSAQTTVTDLATGAAISGANFSLDATMPAHRHGMMTKPIHTETAPGVWRSEGMKLHMYGAWVVNATIEAGGRQDTVHLPWEQPPQ